MIVLDANVLSELIKPAPMRAVTEWVASQPATSIYTTSITQAVRTDLRSPRAT